MYGATIGKTAILSTQGSTNQAICAIPPNEIFDECFLQQFLIKNRNIIMTFGIGAGQPNISQEIIRKFRYFVPALSEQRRIASILSGVDAVGCLITFVPNMVLVTPARSESACPALPHAGGLEYPGTYACPFWFSIIFRTCVFVIVSAEA